MVKWFEEEIHTMQLFYVNQSIINVRDISNATHGRPIPSIRTRFNIISKSLVFGIVGCIATHNVCPGMYRVKDISLILFIQLKARKNSNSRSGFDVRCYPRSSKSSKVQRAVKPSRCFVYDVIPVEVVASFERIRSRCA
jgi:hypothetical protein